MTESNSPTFKEELEEIVKLYADLQTLGDQEETLLKEFRQKHGLSERYAFAQGKFEGFCKKHGIADRFTLPELVALGIKHAGG